MMMLTNICARTRLIWTRADYSTSSYRLWQLGPGESVLMSSVVSALAYDNVHVITELYTDPELTPPAFMVHFSKENNDKGWVRKATWEEVCTRKIHYV